MVGHVLHRPNEAPVDKMDMILVDLIKRGRCRPKLTRPALVEKLLTALGLQDRGEKGFM